MKTPISKFKYVLLLIVIAGLFACKGEVGPAGTDGTNGIDGTDGIDGQDGNANVIASAWITPTWSATDTPSGNFIYSGDTIDTTFSNTGVILSYLDWFGNGVTVYALPTTWQSSGTVSIGFVVHNGNIVWFFNADHNYTPATTFKFRYVLIPASTSSKSANPQQEILYNLDRAGVDVNNYYDVCAYYGIKL